MTLFTFLSYVGEDQEIQIIDNGMILFRGTCKEAKQFRFLDKKRFHVEQQGVYTKRIYMNDFTEHATILTVEVK